MMKTVSNLGLSGSALTLAIVASSCSPKPEATPRPPEASTAAQRPTPAYDLTLDLHEAPTPRKPVELGLTLTDRASGKPPKLKLAHEKLLHLIMVRKDLGSFQHLHPDLQSEGKLSVKATFPTAGEYLLFADFTPEEGEQQVLRESITVDGPSPAVTELAPDADRPKVDGPLKVVLVSQPEQLAPKSQGLLTFKLTDVETGKPAKNLQPYLGAMGHAVILSADGRQFLHAHPLEDGKAGGMPGMDHGAMGHSSPDQRSAAAANATTVAFHTEFPTPGLYKVWGQFNIGGTIRTVSFVVNVNADTSRP